MMRMATVLAIGQQFFSPKGRIARRWYWLGFAEIVAIVFLLEPFVEDAGGRWLTILFFLPIYWMLFCLMSRRCHDVGISSAWLALLFIPVVGIVWCLAVCGFRRGDRGDNQYGPDPRPPSPDYLVVQAVS